MTYDNSNRVGCPECGGRFWPSMIRDHIQKRHSDALPPALSQPTAQEGMPEEKGLLSALKYRVEIEHSRHRIAHFEPRAKETRTDRTLIRFAELIAQLEQERDAWREQANAFEDALKRLPHVEVDIEPLSPG